MADKKLKYSAEEIDSLLQKVKDGDVDVSIGVVPIDGGHRVTINDQIFDVMDGEIGPPGSDAKVTTANITKALGYTPAKQDDVTQLSEEIADYKNDISTEVENQLDGAKADIVAELLAQIGGMPVFGTVDDNNIITVTSTLANGDYTIMYEGVDGTIAEIGTITVENGEVEEPDVPTPSYTNRITSSVNADGSEYVGHNGEDGYSAGYRVNSSGTEVAQSGMCVTGYISYDNETIRLKDVTVAGTKDAYIAQYQSDKTFKQVIALSSVLTDDGTGVLTGSMAHKGFIRITCGVIDDTSILTLNQEIV